MDSEFKKALAGALWAETGDRVDPESNELTPVISRAAGYPPSFSTTETPYRARLNQLFREMYGALPHVREGVPQYDSEVAYKEGSITQVAGTLYYATGDHDPNNAVNPITANQTLWVPVGSRTGEERTAPDAITAGDIFTTSETANKFAVFWTAPDNGGYPISNTQLQYSTSSSFPSASTTTVSPYTQGTEITLTGGTLNHQVYVRLRFENTPRGYSAWSSPGRRVRSTAVEPDPYSLVFADGDISNGAVKVDWTNPPLNGTPAPTNVYVQWKTGTDPYDSTVTGSRSRAVAYPATTATITGLTNGTAYTFRVISGFYASAASLPTNAAEATATPTVAIALPDAPVITATGLSVTSVRVVIDAPPDSNGEDIQWYQYQWREDGGSWSDTNSATSTEAYRVITGLTYDTTYEFRVRAYNGVGDSSGAGTGGAGYGAWSTVASSKPAAGSVPNIGSALAGVRDRATGELFGYLTDDIVTDSDTPVTGFDIESRIGPTGNFTSIGDNVSTFNPSVSTAPASSITLRARAKNLVGDGAWAERTFPSVANHPAKPVLVTQRELGGDLNWYVRPVIDNGGAALTKYRIRYGFHNVNFNQVSGPGNVITTVETDDPYGTITGLERGFQYDLQCAVYNGLWSAWSTTVWDRGVRSGWTITKPTARLTELELPNVSTPSNTRVGLAFNPNPYQGANYGGGYLLGWAGRWERWDGSNWVENTIISVQNGGNPFYITRGDNTKSFLDNGTRRWRIRYRYTTIVRFPTAQGNSTLSEWFEYTFPDS